MYVSSQSAFASLVFSILTDMVAVPSAVKTFNWTATLYKGSISYEAPMIYTFGFLGLFLVGGLTGLFLSSMGLDIHLHDTYFVVAHFHYVMVGGMVMAFLGGLHFWWPKMFGKMYHRGAAMFAAIVIFIGFNLTFFPQFIVGYLGMPRRYHVYPEEFQIFHVLSTAGASVLGFGYLMMFIYFPMSLIRGKPAPANPWPATGLEWEKADSPPIQHNFEEEPVVTDEAYDYANKDEAFYRQGFLGPNPAEEGHHG
jgi:cytochrome c oxidase subunit 1